MTFREFELHRPRLARSLAVFIGRQFDPELWPGSYRGEDIQPRYDDDLRFFVQFPELPPIICVGPRHPMFLEYDDGPGCVGSWWWAYDVPKFQK